EAILDEANAIGTTYLRARFLPEPHRSQVEKLLRDYVELRLQSQNVKNIPEVIVRSDALHEELWSHAVAVAEQNKDHVTGLFIQSLNEVIDLNARRVLVGLHGRIPVLLWIVLYILSVLGMVAVGYQAGLTLTTRSPAAFGLAIAFALVLYLIADLD